MAKEIIGPKLGIDRSIDDSLPSLKQGFKKEEDDALIFSELEGEKNSIFDEIKYSNDKKREKLKRTRATPAARRLIRDENIDLETIMPTGPKGRIQLSDVKKTISMIKAKGYARHYEPVVVKTKLDTLIGHPENTTKISKIFRVAKGQSIKTLLEDEVVEKEALIQKKEMHRNSELDFVPFVENGVADLRDAIVVKPTPIIDGEVRVLSKDAIPEWKESEKYQFLGEELEQKGEKEDRSMEAVKKTAEMNDDGVKKVKQAAVIRGKALAEIEKTDLKAAPEQALVEEIAAIEEIKPGKPLTAKRKMVARRSDSHLENTTITLTIEIDMSEIKDLRRRITKKIEAQSGYRCTYSDFFLMASARALQKHPLINSRLEDEQIIAHDHVSIGLTVSQEDGLVVPVIKNTQTLDFVEMVRARGDMLKKMRGNQFTKEDLSGSTFTIMNLGMYGVHDFTAIINPPNCAILSIGEVVKRMRIVQGEPVIRSVMKASLNLDHRIADGIDGARFLQDLKADVENPSILLF